MHLSKWLLISSSLWLGFYSQAASNKSESPLNVLAETMPGESDSIIQEALQKQMKEAPASKLQSGDVLLFLETPTSDAYANHPMPEAWSKGLQGISHAAIIAKKNNKFYRLNSPFNSICDTEFQGDRPYIIVRKKQQPADFGPAVDKLAGKFADIGYDYDTGFTTEAFGWKGDDAKNLRAQIEAWNPNSKTKPNIPKMYCSELPVTIFTLLGQPVNSSVKMSEVLDIGTKAQIISTCAKKGSGCENMPLKDLSLAEISARIPERVSAAVAQDISDKLVESFAEGYREDQVFMKTEKQRMKKQMNDKHASRQDRAELEQDLSQLDKDLQSTNKMLSDIEGNKPRLNDLVRMKLGLPACANNADKNSLVSLSQKMFETLAYYSFTSRTLVRPVDFLKNKSQFEMVGYYSGNLPATCDKKKAEAEAYN